MQQFVFVEEGGAGRAFVAKHGTKREAKKSVAVSIGRDVRFAAGATEILRGNETWARAFSENTNSNIIKFERKDELTKLLFPDGTIEDEVNGTKPPSIYIVYEGPFGKASIAFNGRIMKWQAYCSPEGAGGSEVMFSLKAESGIQAAREAEALLRKEATDYVPRPSSEEAAAAVKTLIRYAGDNAEREGLLKTPKRVVKSFEELFVGYNKSAWEVLNASFSETGSYDEMVLLTDIEFESHCEHHMVPFVGRAHIAYVPDLSVVGISKLARLVEVFSKRLQIQEKMTTQITDSLDLVLQPQGVAVVVEARHMCMTMRGVKQKTVKMVTSCMTGVFRDDAKMKSEFLAMIRSPRTG